MPSIKLPFAGFYQSIWDQQFDYEVEQAHDHLVEQFSDSAEDDIVIGDIRDRHTDWSKVFGEFARRYVPAFQDWLAQERDIHVDLKFEELSSPREYNFTTDNIYATISDADVQRLYAAVPRDALVAAAKRLFTSRSGFISFYNPDVGSWGDVSTWDYNQRYTLLVALVDVAESEGEPVDDWLLESLRDDITAAYDHGVDYEAIESAITAHFDPEIEPDSKVFPKRSVTDTAEYVAAYVKANHLVAGEDKK